MVSIQWEFSLNHLAIVSLISNVIGTGTCIYFGLAYRHPLIQPSWTNIKDMLGFGKYSLGTNFGALTVRNMDSWMLGKMVSTESVAQYNPAIRISNLVEIPTLTIANLVFPKMAQSFSGTDYKASGELYERSVGVLLGIMIPISIFMFIFSDWIVLIVAGKNYLDSGFLLKITAFYVLFIPFGRQFGVLLDAVRRPKVNFYFVIGTAILNVVISYIFIARWGIVGAAFGTLLTYVIRFIFQQVILYHVFGIFTSQIFPNVLRFYTDVFAMIRTTRGSK
jgi:O-antigen/teichoic acid export membrane protein